MGFEGTTMNTYLLITRSGQPYVAVASYAHDAVALVEAYAKEMVSCWFIGERIPRNAIRVN